MKEIKNGQRNSISDPAKRCQTTAHSSSGKSPSEPHSEKVERCLSWFPQRFANLQRSGTVGGSPVCCFSQMNRQMFGECGALESLNSHTHSLLQYRLHILKCSETSTTHTLQFTSVVIFSPLHFLTAMFAISMFYAPLVFIVSNFAIFVCTAVF